MRFLLALCFVVTAAACGGDDDGGTPAVDSPPPATIASSCMRACVALACGMTANPDCISGCTTDLADCTQAQLEQVTDCGDVACTAGDPAPIVSCLQPITCIEM